MIPKNIFRCRAAVIVVVVAIALLPRSGASGASHPKVGEGACSPKVVVTTNADNGPGSLRQAIADVCPDGTITFDMNQVVSPITLTSSVGCK